MNKRTALFVLSLCVLAGLSALMSTNIIAHAQEGAVNMGAVLDYLLNPKQITTIQAVSQWRNTLVPRQVFTVVPEGEASYSRAQLPVQSETTLEGEASSDEYVYYVLQLEGDTDVFGQTTEGESRYYWVVDDELYIGPVETVDNYAPFNINKMAPILVDDAANIYNESRINIYALVSLENSVTSENLYYETISDAFPVDLEVKERIVVDEDSNALPDDLFGLLSMGQAWFDSDGIRNVAAATLDFPDVPLAPGQLADTARLIPDDPDYDIVVELPTADALGLSNPVVGVVQTARHFGDLFDDALPADVQTALDKAPGAWLEGVGGEMTAIGVVVLHDDGTKAITPVTSFAVDARLEIGNIPITQNPGEVRTLGFWSYPLDFVDDPAADYFSLPSSGNWTPVATEVQYDDFNNILSAPITGGGAIMPMLVATELRADSLTPVEAEICAETPLVLSGSIPVWMGADPVVGLTASEADARYEAVLVNGGDEGALMFREVGGYAVTGLDANSENEAYLTVPDTWDFVGTATLEFRDKEEPANTSTLVDAIDFSDGPPVITLLGDDPVSHECGSAYTDAGATALDACDGDISASIVVGGDLVDANTPGAYQITYNVSDSASNAATEEIRTVNVVDTTAPVITLQGASELDVDCGDSYTDAGATASDACDGDLTGAVVVGGDTVDTGTVGTYQISYNVSDAASNPALEVIRTVNVTDTIPPVITLVGSDPVTVECGDTYTDAGATASDNCDGDLTGAVVVGGDAVDTGTVGTYQITYNVSDDASNAAVEIIRTVNVEDTIPPVLTRNGLQTMTVECGDVFTDPGYTASDVCEGPLPVVAGGDTVDTSVVGLYVITYDASDSQGNAAEQRIRNVVVEDTTNPVLTILGDNPVAAECGMAYVDAGATASDTCDGDLTGVIVVDNAVNAAVPGTYLVSYTVTDGEGNETTNSRTVNVADTTPPVITLNGNAVETVECGAGYTDAGATAFDACDGDLTGAITVGGDVVNPNVVGTYVISYNVTDNASNAAIEATRTVEVEDTLAPVITLLGDLEVIIPLGEEYSEAGATATDACDGDLTDDITIGGDSVNTAVAGTYVITYNVADSEGNSAVEAVRTVYVVDGLNPYLMDVTVLSESSIEVVFSESMGDGVLVNTNYSVSGSGVGTLSLNPDTVSGSGTTYELSWNGCPIMLHGGNIVVTVDAAVEDESNNTMAPPLSWTAFGGAMATLPLISILGDTLVVVECGSSYTDAGATATDQCGTDITGSIETVNAVNTDDVGSYTVSYNVTDEAGNAASEERTVNVVDTIVPVISLLGENPMVTECGDAYVEAGATASDSCEGDLSALISIDAGGVNMDETGVYSITYDVSDSTGNNAVQVVREVQVVDTTPPVMTRIGSSFMVVECGDEFVDPGVTAFDACDGDLTESVIVGGDTVNMNIAETYIIQYNVSDSEANAAPERTRTVVVADNLPPVISLEGNAEVTVECGDVYTDAGATATDACDGNLTSSIVTVNPVDTGVPGDYTLTYNVSDSADNAATEVTRIVTVEDTTPPVITLTGEPEITIKCGDEYTDAGATAMDGCDGDLTSSIVTVNPVDTGVPGEYTLRYNVSDSADNAATEVTRIVTVEDTTPPVITLVGDAEVTVECGDEYTDAGATATDGCDGDLSSAVVVGDTVDMGTVGTYQISYNVSDAASNPALEVIRTVNVTDTVPPVITLVGSDPVTIECGDTYTDAGAAASDNCDGDLTDAIVVGGDAVDTDVSGVYIITYNVSDSAGNSATEVTRTVTVEDTTAPVITLVGDAEVTVECGDEYTDAGATAMDGCDGDLTSSIVTVNPVDTGVPGGYTLRYNVSDNAGNAATEVIRTVTVTDTTAPVITLVGAATVQVDCNGIYTEQGATATDACDGNLTDDIIVGGDVVDTAVPGNYVVTFNINDSASNAAEKVTRTVTVRDNCDADPCNPDEVAPVISLNGASVVTVECKDSYTESGATASDNCEDILPGQIAIGGDVVNTSEPGTYVVTYNVSDSASNTAAEVTRTVHVVDTTPPDIARLGDSVIRVECKSNYNDPGAIAMDACDGNLSASVEVNNPVNTDVVNTYEVVYTVSDANGNEATPVTRTVHVMDTNAPTLDIGELDSTLTYDDDGFLVIEAGTPFSDYESAYFSATDICAGDLGLPQPALEEDASGVLAWAWALTADGEVRWQDLQPVAFPYDTFTSEVGDFLLIYQAWDDHGNSYPEVDSEGIPYFFDDENSLDIFDEDGNLNADYVRLVRIEDTTAPELTLVGGNRIAVDCGVEFVDPGYDYTDNASGEVQVTYSGDPNVNVPGIYVRTYFAVDSEGNEQTLDRVITVRDNCPIVYYSLDVDVAGEGTVEISPEQDSYEEGTVVTLRANPVFKSRFVNWSGDVSGKEIELTLVMDSDKAVLANFNPVVRLTAVVTPPAGGKLTFAPPPVELAEGDEVGAWVATFDTGSIVAVSVAPAERYKFKGWEGDIEEPEGGSCRVGCRRDLETTVTVDMDRDKFIEAVLKKKLPWWVYVLIGIGVAGAIAGIAGG